MTDFLQLSGSEFLVNTASTGTQNEPVVAKLAGGGFVIAFATYDTTQDGNGSAIKARQYDASGVPLGSEFLVNTQSFANQRASAVSGLDGGGYVIMWLTEDSSQDGSLYGLKGQIYDASGVKVGGEFLVNTEAVNRQYFVEVSSLPGGGFVAAWTTTDTAQDGSGYAIKAQVFDAAGAKVGSEFLVNTEATGNQTYTAIASLSGGGYVVTWYTTDTTQDGSGTAVKAQVFDAAHMAVGSEILVNSQTFSSQFTAHVAALVGGGFVVTWETSDFSQDGSNYAIKAQVFDALGAKVGSEFLVNTEAYSAQYAPTAAGLPGGGFLISWYSDDASQDGSSFAIKAQVFDALGAKVGGEFLVNTEGQDDQLIPSIAVLNSGDIVITWQTDDVTQDGSGSAIKAQIFSSAPNTAPTDITLDADPVFENAPDGSLVGYLASDDPDINDPTTFAIVTDPTGGAFAISGNTLTVADSTLLDFSGGASVTVRVSATDSDGMAFEKDLTVDLIEVVTSLAANPTGSEFLMNTQTVNDQDYSSLARLDGGGFVAIWTTFDPAQDGSSSAVKAQIFDAAGAAVGSEILVNAAGTNYQYAQGVTGLGNGGFVVSWQTNNSTQDGSGNAVMGQVFDASGAKIGGEFLLNTSIAQNQRSVEVAGLQSVGFVATWMTMDTAQDGSSNAIKGQLFDAAGVKVGTEFLVNTEGYLSQYNPVVVALSGGGFVVSWSTSDDTQDGSEYAIKAQVFSDAGVKVGGEFLINSRADLSQADHAVTALPNGNFVASWTSYDSVQDGSSYAIKAQVFDAAGSPVGSEFLVNTVAASSQWIPAISSLDDSSFVIAWVTTDGTQDGDGRAIKAQVFDASGRKIGAEFLVNTQSYSDQENASVVGLSADSFLIAWTTYDSRDLLSGGTGDGSGSAIKGQLFTIGAAANVINGTTGNDTLTGTTGADVIYGFEGNDDIDGGQGIDTMYGGPGNDRYVVAQAGDEVVELPGEGFDTVYAYISYTLDDNTEILVMRGSAADGTGGDGFNRIFGNSGANTISGMGGDDVLYGRGGNDILLGGTGNDRLDGGPGDDSMSGGEGDDIYVVNSVADTVFENPGEGSDTIYTYVDYTAPANVENLILRGGARVGTGSDDANSIAGTAGDDTLSGMGGNDKLFGKSGDDILIGGADDDRIRGDAGQDTMTGGTGRDYFILRDPGDSSSNAAFADIVTDFTQADFDKITLTDMDADTTNAPGTNDAFTFIDTAAFSAAGQVRYEHVGSDTHVMGDVDGNGLADFLIVLTGTITLTSGDFQL